MAVWGESVWQSTNVSIHSILHQEGRKIIGIKQSSTLNHKKVIFWPPKSIGKISVLYSSCYQERSHRRIELYCRIMGLWNHDTRCSTDLAVPEYLLGHDPSGSMDINRNSYQIQTSRLCRRKRKVVRHDWSSVSSEHQSKPSPRPTRTFPEIIRIREQERPKKSFITQDEHTAMWSAATKSSGKKKVHFCAGKSPPFPVDIWMTQQQRSVPSRIFVSHLHLIRVAPRYNSFWVDQWGSWCRAEWVSAIRLGDLWAKSENS